MTISGPNLIEALVF